MGGIFMGIVKVLSALAQAFLSATRQMPVGLFSGQFADSKGLCASLCSSELSWQAS